MYLLGILSVLFRHFASTSKQRVQVGPEDGFQSCLGKVTFFSSSKKGKGEKYSNVYLG